MSDQEKNELLRTNLQHTIRKFEEAVGPVGAMWARVKRDSTAHKALQAALPSAETRDVEGYPDTIEVKVGEGTPVRELPKIDPIQFVESEVPLAKKWRR